MSLRAPCFRKRCLHVAGRFILPSVFCRFFGPTKMSAWRSAVLFQCRCAAVPGRCGIVYCRPGHFGLAKEMHQCTTTACCARLATCIERARRAECSLAGSAVGVQRACEEGRTDPRRFAARLHARDRLQKSKPWQADLPDIASELASDTSRKQSNRVRIGGEPRPTAAAASRCFLPCANKFPNLLPLPSLHA